MRFPSRSKVIYTSLAFAIAIVLLYFSLRGIKWSLVWAALASAEPKYVILAGVLGTFATLLRAIRWRILLQHGGPVSIKAAFLSTAAGYFGNSYLPARAGEIVRVLMISAKCGLSKMFVMATALAERVADGVSLVLISSIVLLKLPTYPGWLAHAAKPFGIMGLIGVVGIAVTPPLEWLWIVILDRFPLLPARVRERLKHFLAQILSGLRSFHDLRRLAGFTGMTCLVWFCDAIGVQIGMRALHAHISLPIAFLLITGLGLGSALPSTPGYVGIYQFVAVSVLTPFGLSKATAIAYTLVMQALQYFGNAIWGMIAFTWARDINLRSVAQMAKAESAASVAVD